MELFTLPGQAEGVLRAIYSFFPPAVETEHMVKDANGNMIIDKEMYSSERWDLNY